MPLDNSAIVKTDLSYGGAGKLTTSLTTSMLIDGGRADTDDSSDSDEAMGGSDSEEEGKSKIPSAMRFNERTIAANSAS